MISQDTARPQAGADDHRLAHARGINRPPRAPPPRSAAHGPAV